ncbi:hypothetical protein [Caloranaerobacter sp. DY30410]|uniref:hypothetical protein n=1 Tax=Caloranaerobacter sp. DY30410 TaxID=3238305 RepID=UPI003D023F5B
MYAYVFEDKRDDVGNKLGFLQATVEFALKRDDLRDDFRAYLLDLLKNENNLLHTKEAVVGKE